MKKISILLMLLTIVTLLLGCNKHVHEHVFTSTTATCTEAGENVYTCSCGDSYSQPAEATGHDFQKTGGMEASCTKQGIDYISCTKCKESNNQKVEPYGHIFDTPEEPSDIVACTRDGCKYMTVLFPEDGKYVETLKFNFTEEHEAELDAKYEEVLAAVTSAAKYNKNAHRYSEKGALAEAYEAVDALHTEYYDLVSYAVAQRQIAEIDYYCDMNNTELEERYTYMLDYYTDLIAKFYSLSRPFYDSCYREFFYHGMTEEEIKAYLFDSDTLSNPEYTALKNRNDEIEVTFLALSSPSDDPKVLELYKEFVDNNNKMAKLMGYSNYLEYAYENVYSRDYSYQDVAKIKKYVQDYLVEIYLTIDAGDYTSAEYKEYSEVMTKSFFTNATANAFVNGYFDNMAFTTNPEKQIEFSDAFNELIANGNIYRGNYSGAFVTYLSAFDIPVAYFGPSSYSKSPTIVHEFGHYMNEIYNGANDELEQSYDLLEMHSQGNEIIFLNYLKTQMSEGAFTIAEVSQVKDMLQTAIVSLCVDAFEQAIYLNKYTGTGSASIMADKNITPDEYDRLFSLILQDMGVGSQINPAYWRYVTIQAPCYYVSYAISALSVLQLHEMANTDSLEAATDAYLDLITYTDINPEMTTEKVLINAGMYSYSDERLYKALAEYFK